MRPERGVIVLALVLQVGTAMAETRIDAWPVRGEPVEDYTRAIELFKRGDRQTSTCLFCRGQYRARLYLAARPGLAPDGAPAL